MGQSHAFSDSSKNPGSNYSWSPKIYSEVWGLCLMEWPTEKINKENPFLKFFEAGKISTYCIRI